MKKQEVTPGAVVQTKISKTTHDCNIVGWSADKTHVIVRSCSTGSQVYRTPRQLLLVVR